MFGYFSNSLFGNEPELQYVERGVEQLYNQALDALNEEEYTRAFSCLKRLIDSTPVQHGQPKPNLNAYVKYVRDDYDESIIALDRYVELHPIPLIPPAYYLKGLNFYEQIVDVGRDQKLPPQR